MHWMEFYDTPSAKDRCLVDHRGLATTALLAVSTFSGIRTEQGGPVRFLHH